MITFDLDIIFKTYLIGLGLHFAAWPITKKIFGNLPDKGWPVSRIVATLGAALFIWEISHLGIAFNTNFGLWITTFLLIAVNLFFLRGQKLKEFIPIDIIRIIVMEEYLFIVGYFGISLIRGFEPSINSLEKFMDFGFVNRYLNSPVLPAQDMWQAGEYINYYSFGHFWSSIVVRYFGVIPATGYNLMLGFIAGLSMSLAFSVSLLLAGIKNIRAGIIGGLIGSFSTVLAGNGHLIWFVIKNETLTGYWYAEATRFIEGTIHEFPGYSFVVADLHGHLIDLPIVLTFVLLMVHWLRHRRLLDEVLMGVLFGVMMMTNTWDVAVYGLILVLVGLQLIFQNRANFLKLVQSAGVMLLSLAITALPWLLTFKSISNGMGFAEERSPLWQLGVLWGVGALIILFSLLTTKGAKDKVAIRALALGIILLIMIPEMIYAKDIYPDHKRANTMFKLTYQASIMIGLLAGATWGRLFDFRIMLPKWYRWGAIVVMGTIFFGTMIFPSQAFTSYYGNFMNYKGLDGEAWLKTDSQGKYWATTYLRENKDGKNMVEAVGDSYTFHNAVSVFSSTPTIQGWRVHEWLWRGGYDPVAAREKEVNEIYEGINIMKAREVIQKYNIGWILVGSDEMSLYGISREKMEKLGELIYGPEGTYLVKVTP